MKRYTIKPKKLGAPPKQVGPFKVHKRKESFYDNIIKILLILILMGGIGTGVYFLVTHIQENFGCQSCKEENESADK